eukprot:NODE_18882_length_870_cov_4.815612.p2 GENE.NODE_18882_length_870_cov_4.815612~~NODE_18882_length_870_cov_4.815612.p2  ORF type:complete len:230 (+),score=22.35 NODE_18882_length_870_cov_4.815612:107-796(+)
MGQRPANLVCCDSTNAESAHTDVDFDCVPQLTYSTEENPDSESMSMESLRYSPGRFDVAPTSDEERARERYHEIVLGYRGEHIQRHTKLLESCLRAEPSSRSVLLLLAPAGEAGAVEKIPAMYYVGKDLEYLAFFPTDARADAPVLTLPISCIEAICPARKFGQLADWSNMALSEHEVTRAVLICYRLDASGDMRIHFLMKSQHTMECFVLAMMSLWMETQKGPVTMDL